MDLSIDLEGRTWLFQALVGSHNYNLNTKESDRDYKVFFLPNFDDLYTKSTFHNSTLTDEYDIDAHDIRHVEDLWYKANVNFLEVLFSEELIFNPVIDDYTENLLMKIFDMKDDIARMNLPYLYKACIGMHHNKMDLLLKGTSGTKHLVDEFGYDTKMALHAYRILDFLGWFAHYGFSEFKDSIWYNDTSSLLDIKHGRYSLDSFHQIINIKLKGIKQLEEDYMTHSFNLKTKRKLAEIIKELVKHNI